MNKTPQKRVHDVWGDLDASDRHALAAQIILASKTYEITEATMSSRARRWVTILAVAVYIGFFIVFAERLPREAFVAGILLGVILGASAVFSLLPRNGHNGNGNNE